ncbi:GNAT family N-acetyltransferase [Knoellia sp. LjRoot47]|uniref:GNAT family N-acetyltransferase n=1 Tax=Knoellia sp. LjRoot47 TaxID=3342330 RepID=UPI003ED0CE8F
MSVDPEGAGRSEPYGSFMFTVRGGGREVAGFSSLTVVKRTTAVVVGDAPPKDGPVSEAIALEHGASHDSDFVAWAARGELASHMDLDIHVHDEAGRLVLTYQLTGCWVSEMQSLPDLDGNSNAVTIGHLRLENQGWTSVASVPEPEEITLPDGQPDHGLTVSLRPVAEDWREVGDVRPKDSQRDFVHPMAAGYLLMTERPGPWSSLGIYEGDTVVGHAMWGLDDDEAHWIGGLVIDQAFQGRGLGRAAMIALMAWLADQPGHWVTRLTHHPDNTAAAHLYAELGFTPTGQLDEDGEIILEIRP